MKKIIKPGREDYLKTSWTITYRAICYHCGCEFTYDDLERKFPHRMTTASICVECPHCGREIVEQYVNYNTYDPEHWVYGISGGSVEHEED